MGKANKFLGLVVGLGASSILVDKYIVEVGDLMAISLGVITFFIIIIMLIHKE